MKHLWEIGRQSSSRSSDFGVVNSFYISRPGGSIVRERETADLPLFLYQRHLDTATTSSTDCTNSFALMVTEYLRISRTIIVIRLVLREV